MDYEYDYDEPYEGRVLWGRVAVYGLALILVFILGSCFGGRGAVPQSEVEDLQDQVRELAAENTTLQDQLGAVGRNDDPNQPRVTPTPTPGVTGTDGAAVDSTDPPPGGAETRIYIVESGDSLYAIAIQMYNDGSQAERIAEANGLDSENPLTVGQELEIPPLE